MIKKIIHISGSTLSEHFLFQLVAKVNEIVDAVDNLTKEKVVPRPVDKKVMKSLEHGAQGVTDSIDAAFDEVKEIGPLTPQEVRFFEHCLAGKLKNMLAERGLF